MKTHQNSEQAIMAAWSAAERRIGKFVNLDQDTLNSLVTVPANLLDETIRSMLGRK